MTNTHQNLEFKTLEEKLNRLIAQYQLVKEENSSLKTRQEQLILEKSKLLEKTNMAKIKVEAMINRLKAMELDT